MASRFLLIFLLSLGFSKSVAQKPLRVKAENRFLDSMSLLIDSPPKLRQFLYLNSSEYESGYNDKIDLGFGQYSAFFELQIGKIYLECSFMLNEDSIVSYTIQPMLSFSKNRKKRTFLKHQNWLKVDSLGYALPITKLNEQYFQEPLLGYRGIYDSINIPEYLREYMSFYSGRAYGYLCVGCNFSILRNRSFFLLIEDSLGYEETKLLLYAKNPASRLTAVEFFIRNEGVWNIEPMVNKRMEEVLEVKDSMFSNSCIVDYISIREEVLRNVTRTKENPSFNEKWKTIVTEWKKKEAVHFSNEIN